MKTIPRPPKEWSKIGEQTQETIRRLQLNPPVNLAELSRELGFNVKIGTLPTGISGSIKADGNTFLIRLNRDESRARQRFTLAHEISHALLHSEFIHESADGIVDSTLYRSGASEQKEYEANRLAAEILMPWDILSKYVDAINGPLSDQDVEVLAAKFGVSVPAMEIRLQKLL